MIRNWNLYIFGSENPKDNGKAHICDDDAIPFCGAKIKWGEATANIEDFEGDDLLVSTFGGGSYYRNPQSISHAWKFSRCKKCEAKLNKLKPFIS